MICIYILQASFFSKSIFCRGLLYRQERLF